MRHARRLAAASLLAWAPAALAGPWALGKGHFYSKLSYQHRRATELAAPDGTVFEIPVFLLRDAYFYGSLGLTSKLDLIVDVPLVRSSDLEGFRNESGFGDLQLKLQYQFARRGAAVFAVRGALQFPTGDETRAEGILPTGSGVYEGSLVLGAGSSFGAKGKFYGYVELGPQFRGGGLNDGLVYETQLGWNVTRRLVLAATLRGVQPWSNAPKDVPIGSAIGVSDRVTYTAFGPSAIFKLGDKVALQADVEEAFNTRNIALGLVYRIGIAVVR